MSPLISTDTSVVSHGFSRLIWRLFLICEFDWDPALRHMGSFLRLLNPSETVCFYFGFHYRCSQRKNLSHRTSCFPSLLLVSRAAFAESGALSCSNWLRPDSGLFAGVSPIMPLVRICTLKSPTRLQIGSLSPPKLRSQERPIALPKRQAVPYRCL